MKTTYVERNTRTFQEAVTDALVGHEDELVMLNSTGKVLLATAGNAFGVYKGKLQAGIGIADVCVRMLGKDGTTVVIQAGAVTPGALVKQDGTSPTKVSAAATGNQAIGRKVSPATTGAAGDKIEIIDAWITAP